jgi:hypothetical protein
MPTRHALLTALLISSLANLFACGAPVPKTDAGTGGGGGGTGGQCLDDTDCPDPQLFFCNTTTSKCEPSCRTKDDCSATRRGQYALPFCAGALGCQCDEGKCVGTLCSADSDCGSQVCRRGACVEGPVASSVASCRVSPDFVVLKSGAKAKFWASAWDASKAPVVVQAGATFSAPAGSPLTGSGAGQGIEFTASTPTTGTAAVVAVEAAFGTIKCQAKAIVLPDAPASGQVAVVVTDELSGRPVANADLVLSLTDGSVVQQGGNPSVKTDARGYGTLALTGAPTQFSVTAFATDYSYVTIANYSGTARTLSIVTRRNQVDKYGGYAGTFKNVPLSTANVHAGIAGMSLAGSITNLSLSQLLGPSVPTDIVLGTIKQNAVPVPAGVYLGFGNQTFKDKVAAQGLAGTCLGSDGAPDEVRIAAGTCGTRAAWGLAGDVPLSDLPLDVLTGGLGNINIGQLLGRILPIFKKFNSSVVRDVQFTLQSPKVSADGGSDISDQTFFTKVDQDFAAPAAGGASTQVPLAFNFATKLPDLPKYRGTYVDLAAVIGGANAPGLGVVPLGIGIGVNTDANAQIDKLMTYPAAGLIGVRMAPNHNGLEGSQYGLLVAAISSKAIADASSGLGASAIYARVPANKLVFDPSGSTPIDVSNLSFPPFPDGARFNFTDTAAPGLPARSFRLVASPAVDFTGMNVVRVAFADNLERRWEVIFDASKAAAGFTLPKPPGAFADRSFANGLASGERSSLAMQVLRLNTDPASASGVAISFNDFVELNSTNADRTTDFLTGFSFVDFGKPSVAFLAPTTNMLVKGGKISLQVSKFKLGAAADADGAVKLSFSAAGAPVTGCDAKVFTAETTAGSGQVDYTLPTTCAGANLTFKAELLGLDGVTPIAPAVSTSIVVTVQ